jgi:hypothetical protein
MPDPSKKMHLRMSSLHQLLTFKEVWWEYFCGGMLEPILAIATQEAMTTSNVCILGACLSPFSLAASN